MVYRKQQVTQIATGGINTSPAKQAMQAGLQAVGKAIEGSQNKEKQIEKQRLQAEQDIQQTKNIMMTEGLNAGSKSMQASFATFKNDPNGYAKASGKAREDLKTVYKDPQEQAYFLARYDLDNSVYKAKVDANYKNKKDERAKKAQQRGFNDSMINISNGIDMVYRGSSESATEEEKQAGKLISDQIDYYDAHKDDMDKNGNYLYTQAQRDKASDMKRNKSYYALSNFASDEGVNNPIALQKLKSDLINNKDAFNEQYPMDDDKRTQLAKDVQSAIDGELSAEMLKERAGVLGTLDNQFKAFKFKDGKIKNKDLNNIDDIINYRESIRDQEAKGVLQPAEAQKMLQKTDPILGSFIKEGTSSKAGRTGALLGSIGTLGFAGDFNNPLRQSGKDWIVDTSKDIKGFDKLPDGVRGDFIEGVYKDLVSSGTELNSTDDKTRRSVEEAINKKLPDLAKDLIPQSRLGKHDSNMVMGEDIYGGLSLMEFGGSDTGGMKLGTGKYTPEIVDGKSYDVLKDDQGNIVDKRLRIL